MNAFDLPTLFRFRERLERIADSATPSIDVLLPPPPGKNLAVVSGSFNPPTSAHAHLAERASTIGFDSVLLLLPVAPAGKRPMGLIPEDRLLALHLMRPPPAGIAITSEPLYSGQASALGSAMAGRRIAFVAGSDKLHQIFDPVWYADRDTALESLFDNAALIVGPRHESAAEVEALLGRPENARFRDAVSVMALHPSIGDLSSTRVRGLLGAGADPSGLLPATVARFCEQAGAFMPSGPDECLDPYAVRARVFEMLWRAGAEDADFAGLVKAARAPTRGGRALRDALARGDAGMVMRAAPGMPG